MWHAGSAHERVKIGWMLLTNETVAPPAGGLHVGVDGVVPPPPPVPAQPVSTPKARSAIPAAPDARIVAPSLDRRPAASRSRPLSPRPRRVQDGTNQRASSGADATIRTARRPVRPPRSSVGPARDAPR